MENNATFITRNPNPSKLSVQLRIAVFWVDVTVLELLIFYCFDVTLVKCKINRFYRAHLITAIKFFKATK